MISSVSFKFCPFCGGEMPGYNMMKFCPYCGEKFRISDSHKVVEMNNSIVTQPQIPYKNIDLEQGSPFEIYITEKFDTEYQQMNEYEYYSIMLKYAANTEHLIESLENVLLRSSFAIHLAVDNMPSLIIYKAKKETIESLVEIFRENQASISVISGEFNDKITIEELFPLFHKLDPQIQQGIRNVPPNLWIGDSIGCVFSAIYREHKDAILVISDKNIYICYKNNTVAEYRWLVISYILLKKVIRKDNSLQFVYKGNKIEAIELLNNMECLEVFQRIQRYNHY